MENLGHLEMADTRMDYGNEMRKALMMEDEKEELHKNSI